MIKGYAGRILEVHLGRREFRFQPLDEETARLYIGGKGYGTRLLYDRTEAGIDPLGPQNPLIFATGPLNGSVAPSIVIQNTPAPLTVDFGETEIMSTISDVFNQNVDTSVGNGANLTILFDSIEIVGP